MEGLVRLSVFGVEILLAFALIAWMRSSVRGPAAPWGFIALILAWGAVTALISAYVEIRYSFNLEKLTTEFPELVANNGHWLKLLNNVAASMIEEFAKYMIGVFTVINTRHIHKLSDTIIYLIIIGLGFSLIEDMFFLIHPDTVAPYRLMSFYIHSGTSAIMGYSLGRFKFGLASYRELIGSVVAAICLHFSYNFMTSLESPLAFWLAVLLTVYISLQIFILFRRTVAEEERVELRATRLHHSHDNV